MERLIYPFGEMSQYVNLSCQTKPQDPYRILAPKDTGFRYFQPEELLPGADAPHSLIYLLYLRNAYFIEEFQCQVEIVNMFPSAFHRIFPEPLLKIAYVFFAITVKINANKSSYGNQSFFCGVIIMYIMNSLS